MQRSGRRGERRGTGTGTGDTDAGCASSPGIGELKFLLSRADQLDCCQACLADWRRDFDGTGNPGAIR